MTTPELRAEYRAKWIRFKEPWRIISAERSLDAAERDYLNSLNFQLTILDEYEALLAKHEEWGSIEFREVNMEEFKLWRAQMMRNVCIEESNET